MKVLQAELAGKESSLGTKKRVEKMPVGAAGLTESQQRCL